MWAPESEAVHYELSFLVWGIPASLLLWETRGFPGDGEWEFPVALTGHAM